MEDNKTFNIPLGDGSGFDTAKMPAEETKELNQKIVDTIIGTNDDGSHKIPNEEEWKQIDEYKTNNPHAMRDLQPDAFTIQQEVEDFDFYEKNLKDTVKNNSMTDLGNIKKVRKENDKTKKIALITSSILAIGILSSSYLATHDINVLKENIKKKYLEFNDSINSHLEYYLEPRAENGALYKDLIPEEVTRGKIPVYGGK